MRMKSTKYKFYSYKKVAERKPLHRVENYKQNLHELVQRTLVFPSFSNRWFYGMALDDLLHWLKCGDGFLFKYNP